MTHVKSVPIFLNQYACFPACWAVRVITSSSPLTSTPEKQITFMTAIRGGKGNKNGKTVQKERNKQAYYFCFV